ncbi:MAG: ATP-binding protein [Methanomicrobiales archaeon]|nr:ATP-binding protein [Methanomicrobiales archaeon]
MTHAPGLERISNLLKNQVTNTDVIRFWVIASITISIIGITYLSMAAGYGAIVPQLFYFPILYATYFYPDRGIYVAGGCAAAYLIIALSFVTPDPIIIGGIVFQSLLFIGIAAGSAYLLHSREISLYVVPSVEDTDAIRTMINAGESGHREFKLQALWSLHLTKEQVAASESPDVKKYRTNASKVIIARSIAGFLNTDGGDLLIGIREDRINNAITIAGIENDYPSLPEADRNPDGYRRMIVDAIIRKYLPDIFDTAARYIHIAFPVMGGKTLCHIHVSRSDKPVFLNSGTEELFFIRVDASTREITGSTLAHYTLTRFSGS